MEAVAKTPHFKEIAHFHCELAQDALLRTDYAAARTEIDAALAEYRACARASLLLGDSSCSAATSTRRSPRGRASNRRTPRSGPGGRAPRQRVPQAGRAAQGLRVLKTYQQQYPSLDLLNAYSGWPWPRRTGRGGGADQGGARRIRRCSASTACSRLSSSPRRPDRRHDLELVKQLVGQHIKRLGLYKCDSCGFRARQYYWRCPGCGKWETYSPRRTENPDGHV